MAVRLAKALFSERRIEIGYGVTVTFRRFGYADYKEAEARAHRMARSGLDPVRAIALDVGDDEEVPPDVQDRLIGLASEILLDSMVIGFATRWEGVVGDDGAALPLTRDTWVAFRSELPLLAENLERKLAMPMHMVAAEGKGFAPLHAGDIPAV